MAISFVAASTDYGAGDITPGLPSGAATGDILVYCVESASYEADPTTPTGWTDLGTYANSTGVNRLYTKLTVFWAWYDSGLTTTVTDTGNHTHGGIAAFRGVSRTTPWDVSFVNSGSTSDTDPLTITGLTTVTDGAMVLYVSANGEGRSALSWSNPNLESITEAFDVYSNTNGDGAVTLGYGILATAGASGTTEIDVSGGEPYSAWALALRPAATGEVQQMSADVDNATSVSVSTSDGQPNTWSVPASGNLLIAMVWSGGGTITNPSGWTLRYSHTSDSNNKRYIYEKVSDGTETGLTVSFSTTENHGLALYEVYGEPTWDTGTSGYTSSGTSVASGSSGTLSASEGIAIALSHHWAVSDTSFDSSFTLDADYDGGNNGALYYLGAGHLDLTSTTAINVTSSWTGTSAGTTTLGVWIVGQDRELAATIAASSTDTFGLVQTNQLAGSL